MHKTKEHNISNLIELQSCLKLNKPIPSHVSTWLLEGLNKLESGETNTLDESLNLHSKQGIDKIGTRVNRAFRNACFVELINSVKDESSCVYTRCSIVSQLIKDFHRKQRRVLKIPFEEQTDQEKILLKLFYICENPASSPATLNRVYKKYSNIFTKPMFC